MTHGDTERDAYAEGADAYLAGMSETANPYPEDSDEFLSWNDGWRATYEAGLDDDGHAGE